MAKSQTFIVFNPYLWSPRVTEYFKERLLFGKFFTDASAEVTAEGERLYVPGIATRFTIGDIKTTSGEISATNVSDTSMYLDINKWKGGGFYLSKFQQAQMRKSYRAQERYMQGLSLDLQKTLDTAIWTYTSATNITKSINDSATDIKATTLERGISIVESDSIPLTECAFFYHPYIFVWLLWETIVEKFRKLRGHLIETIRSQTQIWGGSTTIIGIPVRVMG